MTILNVNSTSELQNALNSAVGGDTIVLGNGNYGAVNITKSFGSYVTIKAANPLGAVLADFDMTGGAYVKLDGIRVNNHISQSNGANHLEIANSSFKGMFLDGAGNYTTLNNNDISEEAVTLLNVNNVTLTGNTIHDVVGNDLLQIVGDTHHVLVENNALLDSIATEESAHPDLIQFFQDFSTGKTPHDVTIRSNLLYDDPTTGALGAQGIFIKDPGPSGYKNILIEQNLIASVLYNALTIQGGVENVVLRDNTITQGRIWVMEFSGGNGGTIVEDNVTPVMLNDGGGAKVSHNYIYGESISLKSLFPAYVDGGTWQEYLPKAGSAVDFGTNYGALELLARLKAGGTVTSPGTSTPSTPTNHAPDAIDDSAATSAGKAVTINVLANDKDADGDALTVTSASAGNGSVSIGSNNVLTYTPKSGFSGADTISYAISDGKGGTDTAKATVTVAAVVTTPPPSGTTSHVVLDESLHQFNGQLSGAVVLPHKSAYALAAGTLEVDFKTDTISAARQGLVTKDAVDYGSGGHLSALLEGNDLVVRIQSTTTSYEVRAADVVQAGVDHHLFVTFGSSGLKVYLDGDLVGNNSYAGGLQGNSEAIVIGANGWATNDHNANNLQNPFDGIISKVVLTDEVMSAAAIKQAFPTTGTNAVPVAHDDTATTQEDRAITIDVLANDTDPNGDALTIASASAGVGAVAISGNKVGYTPKADFNGIDTITYAASDKQGAKSTAKVVVTVSAVNDAPVAVNDKATTASAPITVNVLANDFDVDGDALKVTSATAGNGTVKVGAGGVTYTPKAGFTGSDTIIYNISDDKGGTTQGEVAMSVSGADTTGSGVSTIKLSASGDSYEGSPQYRVLVDGVQVGGVQAVSAAHESGHWQTATFTAPSGDFDNVRVEFLNDAYGGSASTDRNLYVAWIEVNGVRLLPEEGSYERWGTSFEGESKMAWQGALVFDLSDRSDIFGNGSKQASASGPAATAVPAKAVFSEAAHVFDAEISSAVIRPHEAKFSLDSGTLAFSFDADSPGGLRQGLVTKEAAGHGDGGHLGVFLKGDDLVVKLESAKASHKVRAKDGIDKDTDHDVVVTFGRGGLKLYLDGKLADSSGYKGGLQGNTEPIVIGASVKAGGLGDAFDGNIQSVALYDNELTSSFISDWHI